MWHSQTSSSFSSQLSSASQSPARKRVDFSELSRLRVLVQHEFPATTDELIDALGACHNNTLEAYRYLKTRRLQQSQVHLQSQTQLQSQPVDQSASSTAATTSASASVAPPATQDSNNNDDMVACTSSSRYASQSSSAAGAASSGSSSAKRRGHDDDDDVWIIENPSKKQKESSPPSSQRSLWLKSSQDVDVDGSSQPNGSSQQSNSQNGTRAPPNTQQQQGDDEVQIAFFQRNVPPPATQEEERVDPAVANVQQSQRLLSQAIEDRWQRRIATDASWISSMWEQLHASSTLELSQQLDVACDALVAWLNAFDERDVVTQQNLGIDLILEIVAQLPRTDRTASELSKSRSETAENDRREQHTEIVALCTRMKDPATQSANARSVAANDAITRLTAECAFHLERIEWFARAYQENIEHQDEVRRGIDALQTRLSESVETCHADVVTGDKVVTDARQTKELRSVQLREFVQKRREELRANGESEVSAEVQAYSDVFNSDDPEILALIDSRTKSGAEILECTQSMQKGKTAYAFYQSAKNLFVKVKERREWSLQNARKSFEDSHRASDERANRALLQYIPMLTIALQEYYKFHEVRQTRAEEERNEQEQKLAEHLEYFGDSAPMRKDDIEKRIQEFVGLISRSTHQMLQIADAQSRLWEGKKGLLSREVCDVLVVEYGKLWKQLSGPVRDVCADERIWDGNQVVKSFVATIQNGSADASTSVPQVESPPAVAESGSRNPSRHQSTTTSPEKPNVPNRSPSPPHAVAPTGTVFNTATTGTVQPTATQLPAPYTFVSNDEMGAPVSMTQEVNVFLRRVHVESASRSTTTVLDSTKTLSPIEVLAEPPPMLPIADQAPATTTTAAASTTAVVHEFGVGDILYAKFNVGDNRVQYFRGRVDKLVDDDGESYSMVYDDGDIYTVPRAYLFTEDQMKADLKLREGEASKTGTTVADAENDEDAGNGTCAIM
ncbi:hypothetical protein FI667_g1572, partial [Globisporangium splendens]